MSIEIKSERISGVPGRRFREGGRLHRNVRIYLEAGDNVLDKIRHVEYELHPTFRQRIRRSEDRRGNFEITIWTWGYFSIQARLFMKDNSVQLVDGYVEW